MQDRLELPEELQQLNEKRDGEDRRKNADASTGADGNDQPAEHVERRSGERRQ